MSRENLLNNMPEDMSKAEAERQLKNVVGAIQATLAEGKEISLIGFGKFEVTERAARMGKNPQTGEALEIAAAKVVKFKPGKALKDAVNK